VQGAADIPKEGSYKGAYSAIGSEKVDNIGNDRLINTFNEFGLEVTNGFLDRTSWRCWGSGDFTKGTGGEEAICLGVDSDGDKIVAKFLSEKHTREQKSWVQTGTCIGGTGKYAGATFNEKDTLHANEFPPPIDGKYANYVTIEGTYKLK
jgi:hypothetical protein